MQRQETGGNEEQRDFDALRGVVDKAFPVDSQAVERVKTIILGSTRLSARDALHLAIMERQGENRSLGLDAGSDGFPGISRVTF